MGKRDILELRRLVKPLLKKHENCKLSSHDMPVLPFRMIHVFA